MDRASPRRRASAARHLSLEPSPPAHRRLSHESIDALEASGHQKKRRRTSHSGRQENAPPDAVDLTAAEDMDPVSRTQAKQRADVILAQQSLDHNKGESVLLAYKCPVCMDTPVDATSTACGHLFCHKCIMDTLKFSEAQRSDMSGKGPRGTCPVCRKYLSRNDLPGPKRNLVPLQIKLTTRKRTETAQ